MVRYNNRLEVPPLDVSAPNFYTKIMVRVAINGYGRIGRIAHRVIAQSFGEYGEVVAINAGSSTDIQGWMYLLKYDSVYGTFSKEVSFQEPPTKPEKDSSDPIGNLIVDGKTVHVYSQKDPSALPWKMLGIDVVIESTGHFRKQEDLEKHIHAGAKKVILSAPASNAASPGKDPSAGSGQAGVEIKYDAAMVAEFQRGNFSGVVPEIMGIRAIPSALPILGFEVGPVDDKKLVRG